MTMMTVGPLATLARSATVSVPSPPKAKGMLRSLSMDSFINFGSNRSSSNSSKPQQQKEQEQQQQQKEQQPRASSRQQRQRKHRSKSPMMTSLRRGVRPQRALSAEKDPSEMNVLATNSIVSSQFTLGHIALAQSNANIVKLEMEDMVNRRTDRSTILTALLRLLDNDQGRSWQYIKFVDLVRIGDDDVSSQVKNYISNQEELMTLLGVTHMTTKPIIFQIKIEVPLGVSLSSVLEMFETLLKECSIARIDFGGALYGYNRTRIAERLLEIMDKQNQCLTDMIALNITLWHKKNATGTKQKSIVVEDCIQCLKGRQRRRAVHVQMMMIDDGSNSSCLPPPLELLKDVSNASTHSTVSFSESSSNHNHNINDMDSSRSSASSTTSRRKRRPEQPSRRCRSPTAANAEIMNDDSNSSLPPLDSLKDISTASTHSTVSFSESSSHQSSNDMDSSRSRRMRNPRQDINASTHSTVSFSEDCSHHGNNDNMDSSRSSATTRRRRQKKKQQPSRRCRSPTTAATTNNSSHVRRQGDTTSREASPIRDSSPPAASPSPNHCRRRPQTPSPPPPHGGTTRERSESMSPLQPTKRSIKYDWNLHAMTASAPEFRWDLPAEEEQQLDDDDPAAEESV